MAERRFFIPEVIQISSMDCGPAAMKALLEGFGISASYGRLREACQTSVDGTNIDTIEDVMNQLGLDAEQIMLPQDYLLMEQAEALPALVVVRLPNGLTHFVVIWNTFGPWVQIMDPGVGRRWVTRQSLYEQLFIHRLPVSARAWRKWAQSASFIEPLRARLEELDISAETINSLLEKALSDPTWRSLAALDAATRMVAAMIKAGGLEIGEESSKLLTQLFHENCSPKLKSPRIFIPLPFWFALDTAQNPLSEQVTLQGAVLIRVKGRRSESAATDRSEESPTHLPPELLAVLQEETFSAEREIWRYVRQDGLSPIALLLLSLVTATIGILVQTLVLQGVLQFSQIIPQLGNTTWVLLSLLLFFTALFILNLTSAALTKRMGRRLETRLRMAFLEKLPRLNDRYFHSRLVSDMAQRAHDLRSLRNFPSEVVDLCRMAFELLFTAVGISLIKPEMGIFSLVASGLFISITLVSRTFLQERGMRLQSHAGALSRFFLDAMQGLIALKTHSAERAFRREYEGLLIEWGRANLDYGQLIALLQALGAVVYSLCSVWVILSFVQGTGELSNVFLLLYWTLRLPVLSNDFVNQLQNYPLLRNSILRLLEPLHTLEDETEGDPLPADALKRTGGATIRMDGVSVVAGGQTLLSGVNFTAKAGEHIAIVGPSGAGKSTLVGLLLGWHIPATGGCYIDDDPLDPQRIKVLRQQTAWVDPAVQLWNQSIRENLLYGRENNLLADDLFLELADLLDVIERLPEGMQTALGESGGLVSGGEGQRVRLGRAMNRQQARLVILDEPFRGLDREKRRVLLQRAREHWRASTLICVTHDVGETAGFDRVLVIEDGRIVEDEQPATLSERPSRYRDLLNAEVVVRETLWQSATWRRLRVGEGKVSEVSSQA